MANFKKVKGKNGYYISLDASKATEGEIIAAERRADREGIPLKYKKEAAKNDAVKMKKADWIKTLKQKKLTSEAKTFEENCDKFNLMTAKSILRYENPKVYYAILGHTGAQLEKDLNSVEATRADFERRQKEREKEYENRVKAEEEVSAKKK